MCDKMGTREMKWNHVHYCVSSVILFQTFDEIDIRNCAHSFYQKLVDDDGDDEIIFIETSLSHFVSWYRRHWFLYSLCHDKFWDWCDNAVWCWRHSNVDEAILGIGLYLDLFLSERRYQSWKDSVVLNFVLLCTYWNDIIKQEIFPSNISMGWVWCCCIEIKKLWV